MLTHLEHRRGRSWYRAVADGGARSWVLDREALRGLRFLAGGEAGLPVPLGPHELSLLEEAERATARRRVLVLLGQRARSAAELRRLLAAWPFSEASVEDAVAWAAELGYLDDRALAREMVALNYLRRPKGRRALLAEMEGRGIAPEVAADELEQHYPPGREQELAVELARRHAPSLKELPMEARVGRLFGYLARRGFDEEAVRRAVVAALGPEARQWLEPS